MAEEKTGKGIDGIFKRMIITVGHEFQVDKVRAEQINRQS